MLAAGLALGACRRPEPAAPAPEPPRAGALPPASGDPQPQAPEFRRLARELRRGLDPMVGDGLRTRLEERLRDPDLPGPQRMQAEAELSTRLLQAGEIDRAIELLEGIRERLRGDRYRAGILLQLGIAHLRKAETENCVRRHNAECCIFPLEGGAVHTERAPAEAARAYFLEYLALVPDDLEVRWLLHVVAMALDEYPEGIPAELRLPEGSFWADPGALRFRDVAGDLGVDAYNLCGGVAVEDFDGDGLLDILTSTLDLEGPLTFYRNTGEGGFEDRSAASRADDQLGGLNLIAGDVDGDGDQDVVVLRGGWLHRAGRIRNSLLRNDGGRFVDVTRAAGLAEPAWPTQAATFGDFDRDGRLDLVVANESDAANDPGSYYPPLFYRNRGDGTFVDRAAEAGLQGDFYCKGITAGDYDNDGDLDLYLSNVGPNKLFRNRGDGTFEDVTRLAGVEHPAGSSFGTWFFDYDNDGWLDLFVAAYRAQLPDLVREALGEPMQVAPPALYRNRGDGTFEDVAREVGLARPFRPMGANFGDVDGDGWLDVYLATGEPRLQSLMPNVMLHNRGGRRFADVTYSLGLGHLQKGHGVAFADLDGDGDLDIYNQLGGFYRVDGFRNALFENPSPGHRWLKLELAGRGAPRDGHGARVRVVFEEDGRRREVHRAQGSVSSFGGSPHRMEIGLGAATRILRLEVRWPTPGVPGGLLDVHEDVPLDALLRVTEGAPELERLPHRARPFRRP